MNGFRRISLVDAIFRSVPGMDRSSKTQEDQGPWLRDYLTQDSTNQDITPTKQHEVTLPHALHAAFTATSEPGDKDTVPELEADVASVGSTDRSSFDSLSYLTELEELKEELKQERQFRAQAEAESKQLRKSLHDLRKRNVRLQTEQSLRAKVIEAEEVAAAKERERWAGEMLKSCEVELEEIGKDAKQALDDLCGMIANGLKAEWEEDNEMEIEIEEWRMDVALATYEEEEEDEDEKQQQQLEVAKMLYQKEHREIWTPTEFENIGNYFDIDTYPNVDIQPIITSNSTSTTLIFSSKLPTSSIDANR